jgi:hypothetical protein
MKYLFFINVQKDAEGRMVNFFGYEDGHALELAYTGEVEALSDLGACDYLFEIFNIRYPRDYRNRSMSVGDVIVLDNGKAYAVEPVGWKEIQFPADRLLGAVNTAYPNGWPGDVEVFVDLAVKSAK